MYFLRLTLTDDKNGPERKEAAIHRALLELDEGEALRHADDMVRRLVRFVKEAEARQL
jgi:hypothetical protein